MESNQSTASGWFNNDGDGELRVSSGHFVDMQMGQTFDHIPSYLGSAGSCQSIGFNAWDACGDTFPRLSPQEVLSPNQLGRLWHPCDAVTDPFPEACVRD